MKHVLFAADFQIWDGDRCIGVALAKGCFAYQCSPGHHLFMGIAENKSGVEANLTAGKTYYIASEARMGGWRARVKLIPVTPDSEFWEKAPSLAQTLNYAKPDRTLLDEWEASKRQEAREVIRVFRSEEGREYVTTLSAESGR